MQQIGLISRWGTELPAKYKKQMVQDFIGLNEIFLLFLFVAEKCELCTAQNVLG